MPALQGLHWALPEVFQRDPAGGLQHHLLHVLHPIFPAEGCFREGMTEARLEGGDGELLPILQLSLLWEMCVGLGG